MSILICKPNESMQKFTPKDLEAFFESSSSFLAANFFIVTLSRKDCKSSELISSKSEGEEKFARISFEVFAKILLKEEAYSGKTWSKRAMVFLLRSPIEEIRYDLNLERFLKDK